MSAWIVGDDDIIIVIDGATNAVNFISEVATSELKVHVGRLLIIVNSFYSIVVCPRAADVSVVSHVMS